MPDVLDKIKTHIKNNSPTLINHLEGVEKISSLLAKEHLASQEKAKIAAWGHDLYRTLNKKEILEKKEKYIKNDKFLDQENYIVLHGPLCAIEFKGLFNYSDEEVLKAIRHHTVISTNPGKLEAILYLADKLEPSKKRKNSDKILSIATNNLWKGFKLLVKTQVEYFRENNISYNHNLDLYLNN